MYLQALTWHQRDAPVPRPNINRLNASVGGEKREERSQKAQEVRLKAKSERAAGQWLKSSPCYRIPGANLSELKKHGKNLEEDIAAANTVIARTQSWPADASSARLVDDESGEMLVCIFSHRLPEEMHTAEEPTMENDIAGNEKKVSCCYLPDWTTLTDAGLVSYLPWRCKSYIVRREKSCKFLLGWDTCECGPELAQFHLFMQGHSYLCCNATMRLRKNYTAYCLLTSINAIYDILQKIS